MKKGKILTFAFAALMSFGALASCGGNDDQGGGDTPLVKVKIGLHTNLGAGAGYSAYVKGFFKEYGIDAEPVLGNGPTLAQKVVNGDIQMSFMGGGVAWHYFRKEQPIKIAALDNLTNDDRLIAVKGKKGDKLTIESPLSEVAEALKGSTIILDTKATPIEWLKTSLLSNINKLYENNTDKLWYTDSEGKKFPTFDSENDYNASNEIHLYNSENTAIPTAVAASGADFVIPFAPVSSLLEKDTEHYTTVVTTKTHFANDYTPSTWAVNTAWLNENEDTFKKVMLGLVKGMNYRRDHVEETCKHIEEVTSMQVTAESLATDIATWLGDKEQLELYNSGDMMKYTENIRQGKLSNENVDPSVTVEKATCYNYLIEACNTLLGK